jgi:hypothetical protein
MGLPASSRCSMPICICSCPSPPSATPAGGPEPCQAGDDRRLATIRQQHWPCEPNAAPMRRETAGVLTPFQRSIFCAIPTRRECHLCGRPQGLKILWAGKPVWVRFPPPVLDLGRFTRSRSPTLRRWAGRSSERRPSSQPERIFPAKCRGVHYALWQRRSSRSRTPLDQGRAKTSRAGVEYGVLGTPELRGRYQALAAWTRGR